MLIPLVAVVAGLGMGVVLLGQMQEVKRVQQQLELSQRQATQLEARNQELTQQLGGLQAERKNLEERLSSLRTQLSSATTDLERSRVNLEELTSRYEQLSGERVQLQAQVASVTSGHEEARRQVQRLEQKNADLERSVSRMRERLTLLDRDYRQVVDKLAKVESTPAPLDIVGASGTPTSSAYSSAGDSAASPRAGAVELPPIIVRKDQAGMSIPVRGRLLETNEAHHFVVVDKGSEDGVHTGMVFDIIRGANSVGRAEVVRVRPQLSACDIIRAKTPGPLQIGDIAVESNP